MDAASEFQLCSTCSRVDFDLILSGNKDDNSYSWLLAPLVDWSEACSLCSYLRRCLPMRYVLVCRIHIWTYQE